jgi:hypothetical protein
MHVNLLDGLSDRVQGIPDNPISNLGGMDFPEFCWLA